MFGVSKFPRFSAGIIVIPKTKVQIGFEVLTAVSTKMAVYRLPDHTALQPRRQPSSKVQTIEVLLSLENTLKFS
jgi:hypothetical protein